MSTNTPHSAAPFLMKSISYDPAKDFVALSRVGSFTQLLLVNPGIPAKSVPELIAHVKANPGKLSFASGNASSVLAGETLKRWAGLDMVHVPYKSAPPAVQDVLGGRVSMLFTDMATGWPLHQQGSLRGLATTRLKRSALVPELPTLDEAGVKGFDMDSWAGLFAPAKTPPADRRAAQHRAAQDHRRPRGEGEDRAPPASRRSRARPRSSTPSSRSSSSNGRA